MVSPGELFRSTSAGIRRNVVVPAVNYLNDITWSEKLKKKFEKLGVFVVVLAVCEFLQEVLLSYFRGTAEIWGEHHGVSKDLIGWFIYTSEVYAGIFALCVAYWGNRIHHRACWIGGLTIFLALAAATLAIPEIYKPYNATEIDRAITGSNLCNKNNSYTIVSEARKPFNIENAIMMQIFQIFVGTASISYYSLGITYIDDHITPQHSPGYIGMIFAAKAVGKQVGIYSSWCPYVLTDSNIFSSPVWLSIASFTLIFGIVTILFPKELPQLEMRRSVDSLVDIVFERNPNQEELVSKGFLKSMMRMIKNKLLVLNLTAYTLVQAALINFRLMEHAFNQSKYHTSLDAYAINYNGLGLSQFTSYLLEQPIVAIFCVATGLLVAKIRPKAKYLVLWDTIVYLLVFMMFTSTVFWQCPGVNDTDAEVFHNNTYVKIQDTCSNKHNCKLIQALSQVNSVLICGLMASVLMSNTIINIRSVNIKDTSLVIGLQATFNGLIPYVFIRPIYYFSAEGFFCLVKGENGCQYYSASLATFLSTMTTTLIFLALVILVWELFVLNDIERNRRLNCDSRDIDICHLTIIGTQQINALNRVPFAQIEIYNSPDGFTIRDIRERTGIAAIDRAPDAPEPIQTTNLDEGNQYHNIQTQDNVYQLVDDPQPSTSNDVSSLFNASLEDLYNTLGDDFDDYEDATAGSSTEKPKLEFEDDIDAPIPGKFTEEICKKLPRKVGLPSFADIKQFQFKNRLAPIKESNEAAKAGDSDSDDNFTSAIKMVVLKKKEDVKEVCGDLTDEL